MDPVYGYQSVNVEAQQRSNGSLLNWVRRFIQLRHKHKAFGRGDMVVIDNDNHKVFAFTRTYKDQILLCVNNLSRYSQPAELQLQEYNGYTPIEMLGGTNFPKIGEWPYLLTMGPHSFYWFELQKK